ncbi:MAG: helix-turn-helix transcriptional regulator [Rhizobiaceae bacterium]
MKSTDNQSVENFVAGVGEKVRIARHEKGVSRQLLSEKSGISLRYLAQLEKGKGNISIALLYKLAHSLELQPDWFLRVGNAPAIEPKKICLIGLRGAGKSTLGQYLAKKLSIEFVELNSIIENLSGIPVAEVMELYSEEGYRRFEREALEVIAKKQGNLVFAVGGGIVHEPRTFAYLIDTFHALWIKATPQEHMQRVIDQGDERPMAGNPKAMEELKFILANREALYSRADIIIDTSGKPLKASKLDMVEAIKQLGIV